MAEEVLKLALDLGMAISASEEFTQLTQARNRLDADETACAIMNDFETTRAMLEREDMTEARIEAVSARLMDIQNDMLRNDVFSEFLHAQNEFAEMMKQVNKTLAVCITGVDAADEECTGSCSSCGAACKH